MTQRPSGIQVHGQRMDLLNQQTAVRTPQFGVEDGTLVRRSAQGDTQAFGELVRRHERRITNLAKHLLGPMATQEDVSDTVQDIFIQVWKGLSRFRGDAEFGTWVYRIAVNTSLQQWKKLKRLNRDIAHEDLGVNEQLTAAGVDTNPAEAAEAAAKSQALHRAIDKLPEKHRVVVLLHYFDDITCDEIATMVGCSVGTVWSRLHYACRKLRTTMDWPLAQ